MKILRGGGAPNIFKTPERRALKKLGGGAPLNTLNPKGGGRRAPKKLNR